ncbi:MAG: hypothetical protein V1862_03645 [Methanobacteriota archaeon]
MTRQMLKKQVNYALLVATILMVITGLGILEPGIITPLTFGMLGKLTSYRIHILLWGPFAILFIIHITLNLLPRRWL